MKKRCVLLSKMVALLIALLLLLVPMVAHTSEGDAWAGSGSGLQGMQTEPGIVPFNGDPPSFEIGAPDYEGGELNWGNVATIRICNDGCNVEGSCCDLIEWCQTQCPHCRFGHVGRSQNVYIRGAATGPVTWRIECYGGVHRDEISIRHDPAVEIEGGGTAEALVIGVREGWTICRGRTITLEVTRYGVTARVFIELIACCFECGPFCLGCDECFHCTVDPCVCTSGLCEKCCPCPRIVKSAAPVIVSPGDYVVYIIEVTRGDLGREGFRNISVVDRLDPYLEFVPGTIHVEGVVPPGVNEPAFDYCISGNVIRIYNMNLDDCDENEGEYVDYVTITFKVRVRDNAPPGKIPNTAFIYLDYPSNLRGRCASAEITVRIEGDVKDIEIEKLWNGMPAPILEGINYIVVELVEVEGERLISLEPQQFLRITPDANGNWFGRFEGLPRLDAQGNPIIYTIREVAIDYDGNGAFLPPRVDRIKEPSVENEPWRIVITNTYIEHDPYGAGVINLRVTKDWVGDTPANRPANIQVELLANGNPLNPPRFLTITPDENGNWAGAFIMPAYDANGNAIDYSTHSIREINVPRGYTSRVVEEGFAPPTPGNNAWTITLTNTLNQGQAGGPLTGDFTSTVLLLASFLFAMSGLLGGSSLKRKLKDYRR